MTDTQKTLHLASKAVDMWLSGTPNLALRRFNAQRVRLSPWDVARIDPQLRRVHRNVELRSQRRGTLGLVACILSLNTRVPEREIASNPLTALLFVHCHDGRLREAAVRSMPIDVEDSAAQTALLLRCNDWAPQVREAAFDRLRLLAPQLSQTALARLVIFALARVGAWQRGGAEGLVVLKECPLWLSAMEEAFAAQADGPLVHVFKRQILEGTLDHAVTRLARSARSPLVRSTATECVLTEQVRCKSGDTQQWVSKPLGISRHTPLFEERNLEIAPKDCAAVLRTATHDTCAMVRKKVADKFIRDGGKDFCEEVKNLTEDPAISVRSRMEFFHRKYLSVKKKGQENG